MGKPTGFLEVSRQERGYTPVDERLKNFHEFVIDLSDEKLSAKGSRCLD